MKSRFSHWLTRFFIIILIGLAIPSQIGQAQSTDYPIVDTGQSVCYDASGAITCPTEGEAFYGQDAQYTGNASSYTDNGDGTITDNITGLIWQQSPDTDGDGAVTYDDKLTYTEAQAYPDTLNAANYGGYSDWRLPTIKELFSLTNYNGMQPGDTLDGAIPFIDTDYFEFSWGFTEYDERYIDSQWATSNTYIYNSAQMFGVNFADGRIKGYGPPPGLGGGGSDKPFFVICVRGNTEYGINDFEGNSDGTITDHATGLMWTQDDSGAGLDWEDALAWVQTKNAANYLGHDDWRLPNVKELQSILDYTRSPDTSDSAAIDPIFSCTQITNENYEADYPWYWSGTTLNGRDGTYVSFGRALGYMGNSWVDIHGAGAQRSDPKGGDFSQYTQQDNGYYNSRAPQGDAIRIYNYVRLVRDADSGTVVPPQNFQVYLPLVVTSRSSTSSPA
ncbi:MAG: DUF1566 domain-containing protein, partial [Chloroflexi bacterium]|nr:DUF1566 domain-containing protein [Chloroflexota bacterium]